MPRNSRARTRAARARQAAVGGRYTDALADVAAAVPMDRDTQPAPGLAAMLFMDVMIAGKRASAAAPDGDWPAAVAAVRAAITPLWPHVIPEAARDVLTACAGLAVSAGVPGLPGGLGDETAAAMLELAAERGDGGRAAPAGAQFTPLRAFASSVAFDRDEDAATFGAVCVLLALAHPPKG